MTGLTEEEKRYHRHLILPDIGEQGQLKLKACRALVVGSGGLGSPVLFYLAAAGIGTIGVVDSDQVDLSNLQRQILHSTDDLGKLKINSAFEKLSRLNPNNKIITFSQRLNTENAIDIISDYDIVVDATDNFATRFILNEACIKLRIPFVHVGIFGFYGQAMTILPGAGPCFRCLVHNPPTPESSTSPPGVLGAVAGTIGTIQAAEVVKFALQTGSMLVGRLLLYDALEMQFREETIKRDAECPICSNIT